MKVWVVTANSWNGSHDSISVDSVWITGEAAQKYCDDLNAKRSSSYSTSFEAEEYDVIKMTNNEAKALQEDAKILHEENNRLREALKSVVISGSHEYARVVAKVALK